MNRIEVAAGRIGGARELGRDRVADNLARALDCLKTNICSYCRRSGPCSAIGERGGGYRPACKGCVDGIAARDRLKRELEEHTRQAACESGTVVRGCGVLWDDVARLEDGTTESLVRGTFTRSLQSGPPVVCRLDHDPRRQLGTTDDWSLDVEETNLGLFFRLELKRDSAAVRALRAAAQADRIGGVSLGFSRSVGERVRGHRAITSADLIEVSILLAPRLPAYRRTWALLETKQGPLPRRAAQLEIECFRQALSRTN